MKNNYRNAILWTLACAYVFLGADFLAATQVLIYVGGILVLLLFGVMLTHRLYSLNLKTETFQILPGLLNSAVTKSTGFDQLNRRSTDERSLVTSQFPLPALCDQPPSFSSTVHSSCSLSESSHNHTIRTCSSCM